MARIRTIKPDFWDDEKLATISRDSRLLFIAMWNFSDDYSVVKGHPSWLKNKVFPYDDIKQVTFNEWIHALEKIRAIIPFDHNGEKFYYIRTFKDHQKVDRPSTARNPEAPADILESNRDLFDEDSTSRERVLVAVKEGNSKGREGKGKREDGYADDFLSFYEKYPKKEGKAEALKAWKKINPQNGLKEILLTAIEKQTLFKSHLKETDQFCPEWPNPATWLNQKRWEDEIPKETEGDIAWYEKSLRRSQSSSAPSTKEK
jgi:hypothetical protein